MKHFEYAYYNIYTYCQERNQDLTNLSARLMTMLIVSLSAGGYVLLLQTVFLRLVRQVWYTSQPVAMSFAMFVYIGAAAICYRIFIANNYDEKIYNKYATRSTYGNRQRDLFLAGLLAVVPYLLMIGFKLVLPE